MLNTIGGIVRNGKIELTEKVTLVEGTRVLVTALLTEADEEENFWTHASENSLKAVWDNPADDVYADLLKE